MEAFEVSSSGKPAKKRGVQKLLRSAFKRGAGGESSGSGSDGSVGRPPAWRAGSKGKGAGSLPWDDSSSVDSRDSDDLDGSKDARLLAALRSAKILHAVEPAFPWEMKMSEMLPVPNSSSFMSLLLLPRAVDAANSRYNSLEDTLARANAWLASSQSSGIPIVFVNIQTEGLLTKVSGDVALSTVNTGSLADLGNMANASLYGFEDYHGVDIGVMRAVRLWYAPVAGEMAFEMKLKKGDTRLGFAISRTEEGFIYISSVAEACTPGVASTRSGLLELYREAEAASKLLVVSRVGEDKVLPWMVASSGDVKCFDTVSLSQKLSLHRHALRTIKMHFLLWDDISPLNIMSRVRKPKPAMPPVPLPPPAAAADADASSGEAPRDVVFADDSSESAVSSEHDVQEQSFRFQNISLPSSWV